MDKSSRLYKLILTVWLTLMLLSLDTFYYTFLRAEHTDGYTGFLVGASMIFISYFWLNGTKDLIYTLYFYLFCKKSYKTPSLNARWNSKAFRTKRPKVLLVYCTCNDFSGDSLLKSMNQTYKNIEVVILDDSNQKEYKTMVNAFGDQHNIKVIRRRSRVGFKAGNLNHYLKKAKFDYFVILDSDEIIPRTYINRSLDYFAGNKAIGIVQANHIATRNRNPFMKMFARGVDSHWPTYQMVKSSNGFLSLLGHGAMVSNECYQATGGFPHVVAEDLCFSIEARNKGYFVAFAPDIICEEEYPISYLAFKKRHSKWTQGNMEFIKTYTANILNAQMKWFEKFDIILFTYNLPLHAFFSLFVAINVILLPAVHYHLIYPLWMLIPTIIFLISPMLNDMIYYFKEMRFKHLCWYLLHTLLLFGSMFFISLQSSLKSLVGGSTFIVTPKTNQLVNWRFAFKANMRELIFAFIILAISTIMDGNPLPVIMIALPSIFSVYLARLANERKPLESRVTIGSLSSGAFSWLRSASLSAKTFLPFL